MQFLKDVDIKEYSNMKVGGIVSKMYFPTEKEDILEILKNEKNIFFMGNGTNILFDDGYLPITVVNLKNMNGIEILEKTNEYEIVKAYAGVDFKDFINFNSKNNLHGLENMTGIPGSIGGMVAMNAGAYGTEIFDLITEVEVIYEGKYQKLKKEEINFSYRTTDIRKKRMIVLSATFKFTYGFDELSSKDKILQRQSKHPLDLPNLGSTFKNPKGEFAAQIISDLGLKNYKIGGACISSKHPNFITNIENASFNDVINIIEYVKKVVKKERNIDLETEIIILKSSDDKNFKHELLINS